MKEITRKASNIIIIVLIIAILGLGTFFAFKIYNLHKSDITGGNESQYDQLLKHLPKIVQEYELLQDQFAIKLPCGVNDFDSPYVREVKCDDSREVNKGERVINFSISILNEEGEGLEGAKVVVNNGKPVFTDIRGIADTQITINLNRKVVNLIVDKDGYSPIRKVFNAETINNNKISIPDVFRVNIIMREVETVDIKLISQKEVTIISKKYPGVSVVISSDGLENSNGEIVKGDIVGDISYLNPDNPEDVEFIPGFEGNSKQMIGVNRYGQQVTLDSAGMVMVHFRKKGSAEILQPRKGSSLTITHPMLEEEYNLLTGPKAEPSEEEKENAEAFRKKIGLRDDMTEAEKFKIMLDNDLLSNKQYWYFNQRTGLWEDWPVKYFKADTKNKTYTLKVVRLY